MMLLALLAAAGAALSNPMPRPGVKADPCAVAADCRYVKSYVVNDTDGTPYRVKVDTQTPWFVNGALTLYPGELVVIRLVSDGDGVKPVVVSYGKADEIDIEAAAQELHDMMEPDKETTGPLRTRLDIPRPEDDTIRLSFRQVASTGDMVLMVEDGYGRTLDYKAVMLSARRARVEPTTVCTVRTKGFMRSSGPTPSSGWS